MVSVVKIRMSLDDVVTRGEEASSMGSLAQVGWGPVCGGSRLAMSTVVAPVGGHVPQWDTGIRLSTLASYPAREVLKPCSGGYTLDTKHSEKSAALNAEHLLSSTPPSER